MEITSVPLYTEIGTIAEYLNNLVLCSGQRFAVDETKVLDQTTNRPRILVVDDDTWFLFGISEALKKKGFEVITANNGVTAVMKARSEKPDFIILDVNMPKLNGLNVKKILNYDLNTKNIPTIFLTGLNDRNVMLYGLSIADDCISKPFDIDLLIMRLWAVFRRMNMGYKMGLQTLDSRTISKASFPRILKHVDVKT